ncbi:hypothetical protein [Chengkuizengella marina]|uniref:hypothetical protein n=1 Tax=Chengkuizengella marina TaxID=2507566 RepID=UPI00137059CD|nr:hypothetical protein [Chengkuizengella marina]
MFNKGLMILLLLIFVMSNSLAFAGEKEKTEEEIEEYLESFIDFQEIKEVNEKI